MLPDRVSNSGPLTYESSALPISLPSKGIKREFGDYIQNNASSVFNWGKLQLKATFNLYKETQFI